MKPQTKDTLSERHYERIVNVCVLITVFSALLFDHSTHPLWCLAIGFLAATSSVVAYFILHYSWTLPGGRTIGKLDIEWNREDQPLPSKQTKDDLKA